MKPKPNHFKGMKEVSNMERSNGRNYTLRANRNRFFFPDEWVAFYDVLNNRQKITFNIAINTGARINEIRNIKVQDIDLLRQNIVLRVTKRIVNRPGVKQGQRKIRVLPISNQFTKYLKRVITKHKLKPEDYLPILSTPAANIAMKKALKKVGISDWEMFSFHNVRKTLETWLMALDVNSFKITKHFGHSLAIAAKHYVSPDIFNYDDKRLIRQVIGDLFERR